MDYACLNQGKKKIKASLGIFREMLIGELRSTHPTAGQAHAVWQQAAHRARIFLGSYV